MAWVIVGLDEDGKVEAACLDEWNPAGIQDVVDWIRRGLTVKLVPGPVVLGMSLPEPEPPKVGTCVCGHLRSEHEPTRGVSSACYITGCDCMVFVSRPKPPKADSVQTGKVKPPSSETTTNGKEWVKQEGYDKKSISYQGGDSPLTPEWVAPFTELELRDKLFATPATNSDELARLTYPWFLARMGQPSVTTEKLADFMEEQGWWVGQPNLRKRAIEALMKAFPSLGQGRLTRDELVNTIEETMEKVAKNKPLYHSWGEMTDYSEFAAAVADRLLALQGPVTVGQPSPVTAEKLHAFIQDHGWWGALDNYGLKHCQEIVKAFPTLGSGRQETEQLQVQLAGCGAAALGNTDNPAKCGDYGWSQSYQDVLELRLKFDATNSGRLTREQIADAYMGAMGCRCEVCRERAEKFADNLLAIQGPMTVSKEQIQTAIKDIHVMPLVQAVEQVLKNLGMEVEDK